MGRRQTLAAAGETECEFILNLNGEARFRRVRGGSDVHDLDAGKRLPHGRSSRRRPVPVKRLKASAEQRRSRKP
jgi:hypothetical protein